MTEKKMKKDREIVLELESQIKEIRHQLNEQLRCLDQRLEGHYCMVWELQDFYQRRAELELDYARNLDKLVKQIMIRHRTEKQRREQWPVYSTYKMWQTLLGITTKQSRNHNILAETFGTIVTSKFSQLLEDMQRIYKKCREIAVGAHDEMTKVATELHSSMKTYHVYHEQSRQSHSKLQRVQSQRDRIGQESKKNALSKRVLRYEKQTEKHQNKYSECNLKATKARNDYIISMVSANAAIRKFFVDDLPELINTMDYGYHVSLGQMMMIAVSAEQLTCKAQQESLDLLASKAKDLNQREDRQAFLQQFHQIFSLPKKFDFQPHKNDTEYEVSAQGPVGEELLERFRTINERLHTLKVENEELWKTLETTDNALLERLTVNNIDLNALFSPDREQSKPPTTDLEKQRAERLETEVFYINKFTAYQSQGNLIARLQAKCTVIDKALVHCNGGEFRPASVAMKRKRALGKSTLEARPKLFGGSIEEYVQATGQEIPSIVKSCVRIINLYGMHHQGVFRVSGLQHEINDFKNQFERGEEPLLGKADSRDINSVAGVLKLYFRELHEPLFPLQLFDELIACSKYDVNDAEELKKCILRLQELLLPLPRPIVIVSRYLFAFLNHLSELSDENMMDAHNLAVCFGPTLLPMPPDHDQVRYQNHVNELIRILIVYHEKIFLNDGGLVYEKCMVEEEGDVEDSLDSLLEDVGLEGTGSEDDLDSGEKEAVVLFDFQARNARELTLKKGDSVSLSTRINNDWWRGSVGGQTGLVPHSYVEVLHRSSKDKSSSSTEGHHHTRMSTESLPAKSFSAMNSTVLAPVTDGGEMLDRSISQPNISGAAKLSIAVPASPTVLASCSSTSSDLSRGGYASADSLGSMSSKDDVIAPPAIEDDTLLVKLAPASATDATDGVNCQVSVMPVDEDPPESALPSLSVSLEPTPDLVLNLPTASTLMISVRPLSPPLTTAEVFASAEHGTIKKGRTASAGEASAASVDVSVAGTDEVFPSTPAEIVQALESSGMFNFDLLPPPPPLTDGCPADTVSDVVSEEEILLGESAISNESGVSSLSPGGYVAADEGVDLVADLPPPPPAEELEGASDFPTEPAAAVTVAVSYSACEETVLKPVSVHHMLPLVTSISPRRSPTGWVPPPPNPDPADVVGCASGISHAPAMTTSVGPIASKQEIGGSHVSKEKIKDEVEGHGSVIQPDVASSHSVPSLVADKPQPTMKSDNLESTRKPIQAMPAVTACTPIEAIESLLVATSPSHASTLHSTSEQVTATTELKSRGPVTPSSSPSKSTGSSIQPVTSTPASSAVHSVVDTLSPSIVSFSLSSSPSLQKAGIGPPQPHGMLESQPPKIASAPAPEMPADSHVSPSKMADFPPPPDCVVQPMNTPSSESQKLLAEPAIPLSSAEFTAAKISSSAPDVTGSVSPQPQPQMTHRLSLTTTSLPQSTPPTTATQSAISHLVLATHRHATSVAQSFHPEPFPHRPTPSLAAHSAVLELLTHQKDADKSSEAAGSGKHDVTHGDKPKAKAPPPVKRKPVAPGKDHKPGSSPSEPHH